MPAFVHKLSVIHRHITISLAGFRPSKAQDLNQAGMLDNSDMQIFNMHYPDGQNHATCRHKANDRAYFILTPMLVLSRLFGVYLL